MGLTLGRVPKWPAQKQGVELKLAALQHTHRSYESVYLRVAADQ
jgi:hypothetical protein